MPVRKPDAKTVVREPKAVRRSREDAARLDVAAVHAETTKVFPKVLAKLGE